MVELSRPLWSDDGTKAVVQARADDNKDRWIMALDEATGKTRVLAHDHDDDWLDGPGANTLGWMKDDRDVYFQSERTGYSHLYAVPFDGGEPRALTSGNWEVASVDLSRDKTRFFLVTSEADPGEHNVYEMSADGGPRTRLTSLPGGHSCTLSPDDQWFADIYSYTNKPPEFYVQESRPNADSQKAHDLARARLLGIPVARRAHRPNHSPRRRHAARTPFQARQLPARRPGGDLRPRRRLSTKCPSRLDLQPTRTSTCSTTC